MAKVTSRIVAFKDFFVAVPVESAKLLRPVIASNCCAGDYDYFLYKGEIEIGFMDDAYEAALGGGLYEGMFWVSNPDGELQFVKSIARAIVVAEKFWKKFYGKGQ